MLLDDENSMNLVRFLDWLLIKREVSTISDLGIILLTPIASQFCGVLSWGLHLWREIEIL